jgi:hypothetical protein
VTVSDICESTGYTRQWLNKLADRGEIPGCSRNENERLQFEDTSEFRKWIKRARANNEFRNLKRSAQREKFDQKPLIPGESSFRPCDLAKIVGCSAKTITRNQAKIPGVTVYFSHPKRTKYQVRFKLCAELSEWIAKTKAESFYTRDYARERERFPNDLHLAKLHLQSAAKLLLDYNAKISAWDWNANTSVTIADQIENFWEKIKPIRQAVSIDSEEHSDDDDFSFEKFYKED